MIPTLIMVESPQATLYDPIASTDPLVDLDDTKKQPLEPELLLVQHKPITSSFRSTLAHLRARAGRGSRVRGFMIYILSAFVVGYISRLIGLFHLIPFRTVVAPVLAETVAAHFFLLWTHVVISAPTATRWYKRFAPLRTWKKIAGPTALAALTKQTAIMVPVMLFIKLNQQLPTTPAEWSGLSCHERSKIILQGFGVAALSFVFWILLVIPAKVTLTRVQASLLAEREEPIVPFDRTFGGKTEPNGVLGMLDAWRSFDGASRIRLLKAYFKAAAIQIALTMFFWCSYRTDSRYRTWIWTSDTSGCCDKGRTGEFQDDPCLSLSVNARRKESSSSTEDLNCKSTNEEEMMGKRTVAITFS